MSIQAVAWVLEHSQAKLADRLVLIAIANHVNGRSWDAWPSIEKIAEEAGVHEVTVWRSIKVLEELGELTVQRRPGKLSRYSITALSPLQPAEGEGLQDARTSGVASRNKPLASRNKPLNRMQPEPVVTVKEPTPAPVEYDPDTLEKDAEGRWFVRTSTPVPKPVTQTTMPPELSEETRAKGAQWARALRQGGDPT